jgi:thioesterase-3
MKTSTTIEVRSTEIDSLGHVNNAKYLEYLEWGRVEWLKQTECSFQDFHKLGFTVVVVNINISYRKEAKLGDLLTITTVPFKTGKSSFVLRNEIYNEKNELVTDALVTLVAIDLLKRTAIKLPKILCDLLSNKIE